MQEDDPSCEEAGTVADPADDVSPLADGATGTLAGCRLLVVDDSHVNRDIARRILERHGALVETAEGARAALQALRDPRRQFDLVLMDIQMPRMDGVQTTRMLRSLRFRAELPVIAVTGSATAAERERALRAGMNDYITKPFDPDGLIACVAKYLGQPCQDPLVTPGPPPPPTASPWPDWPSVDGIDTAAAHARLDGDSLLFRRLLSPLKDDLSRVTDELPEGPQACSPTLAAHLHRLRGTAGNLGASSLARAVGVLEDSLRAGTAPNPEMLTTVRSEMDRLRTAIAALLDAKVVGSPRAAPPDASVQTFAQRLRERDLRAISLYPAVAPVLEPALGVEKCADLYMALQQLDFASALAMIDDLEG